MIKRDPKYSGWPGPEETVAVVVVAPVVPPVVIAPPAVEPEIEPDKPKRGRPRKTLHLPDEADELDEVSDE